MAYRGGPGAGVELIMTGRVRCPALFDSRRTMTNVVSPNKKKPSPDWITPQALVDVLNLDYRFTLDPAASRENAKCPRFYTREDDGLSKSWAGERVFCNPPYGAETPAWVEKGVREYRENGTFSAFL